MRKPEHSRKFHTAIRALQIIIACRKELNLDVAVCLFWNGRDYTVSPIESKEVQNHFNRYTLVKTIK